MENNKSFRNNFYANIFIFISFYDKFLKNKNEELSNMIQIISNFIIQKATIKNELNTEINMDKIQNLIKNKSNKFKSNNSGNLKFEKKIEIEVNQISLTFIPYISLLDKPFSSETKLNELSKSSGFSILYKNNNKHVLKILCNNSINELQGIFFHYIIYIYYYIKNKSYLTYLCYIDHFGKMDNLDKKISNRFSKSECKIKNNSNNNFYYCTLEDGGMDFTTYIYSLRNRKIGLKEILNIMIQSAESINLFHSYGVEYCHLDIKLDNFLIKNNNVKIIDFGFVKKVNSKNDNYGTPNYMNISRYFTPIILRYYDIYSLSLVFIDLICQEIQRKNYYNTAFFYNYKIKNGSQKNKDKLNEQITSNLTNQLTNILIKNYPTISEEVKSDIIQLINYMYNPTIIYDTNKEYYPMYEYYSIFSEEEINNNISIDLIILTLKIIQEKINAI